MQILRSAIAKREIIMNMLECGNQRGGCDHMIVA